MRKRAFLMTLRVMVVGVVLMGVRRASFFTVYRVAGTSMLDTLQDGDRITITEESQEPRVKSQQKGKADSQDSKAEQLKRRSSS